MTLRELIQNDTKLRYGGSCWGGEWYSGCPFCGGKDRFRYWPNFNGNERWTCRQCQNFKIRSIYGFIMEREHMTYREARQWLEQQGGLPAPKTKPTRPYNYQPLPNENWQQQATQFCKSAAKRLTKHGDIVKYLKKERHLTDRTIEKCMLGYNPFEYQPFDEFIRVPQGIIIPWVYNDKVICISVRRGNGTPKYKTVYGSKRYLYHLPSHGKDLIVVEGEFDAMLIWQETKRGVIATGSSSCIPRGVRKYVRENEVRRLVIISDNDEAGELMDNKWQNTYTNCVFCKLPSSVKDVTEFVGQGGCLNEYLRV